MMTMSAIKLVGALSFLSVTSVMGQSSCVQLNATVFSSCPCTDATLTFTLEGETTVAANTVSQGVRITIELGRYVGHTPRIVFHTYMGRYSSHKQTFLLWTCHYSCRCTDASLTFTVEEETTVSANTVGLGQCKSADG